jgi:Polyketide cyclase / dehydrase and lipid transport
MRFCIHGRASGIGEQARLVAATDDAAWLQWANTPAARWIDLSPTYEVNMSVAPAWHCERSIDVDVPVSFAWAHMTDIRNWNDPPAEFALEGPFVTGARGTTRMPGQPLLSWTIRDLEPGREYTIESSFLERAVLLSHWRFDPLSKRAARLTQRMELLGDNADAYVDAIKSAFEPNLEPGMRKIAQAMERRHREAGAPRAKD